MSFPRRLEGTEWAIERSRQSRPVDEVERVELPFWLTVTATQRKSPRSLLGWSEAIAERHVLVDHFMRRVPPGHRSNRGGLQAISIRLHSIPVTLELNPTPT